MFLSFWGFVKIAFECIGNLILLKTVVECHKYVLLFSNCFLCDVDYMFISVDSISFTSK